MSDSPFLLGDGNARIEPGQLVYVVDSSTGAIHERKVTLCIRLGEIPHIVSGSLCVPASMCFSTREAARGLASYHAKFGVNYHGERLELCRRALAELEEPDDLPVPLVRADGPEGPADDFSGLYHESGEPVA